MHFPTLPSALLLALAIHSGVSAAADEKVVEPCTVASSAGSFYDLRKLTASLPKDGKKAGKNDKVEDWHAKGYDYPANFTLNICAPVVSDIERPVGISKKLSQNVSAYYELGSKTYSIGSVIPPRVPKLH
jgi:cation-dependent mannose-6-phosphate receptor